VRRTLAPAPHPPEPWCLRWNAGGTPPWAQCATHGRTAA
jgi:hypothetical protein